MRRDALFSTTPATVPIPLQIFVYFWRYRSRIGQTAPDLSSTSTPKEYQRYAPSKDLLKAKILKWLRVEEAKA